MNGFFVLRSIPSGTSDINLKSCVLNRHKLRQSQIATNQESLTSQFVICRNLWFVTICDLSQFVIKAVTAQPESNNTENVFWVLGRVPMFTFDMNVKSCTYDHLGVISLLYLFVCTSDIISINDVLRKTPWNVPMSMWTYLLYLGLYPRILLKSIWEVVFWTVINCDSHMLRQIGNPCRRNLWFVAICDQDCAVGNSVQ